MFTLQLTTRTVGNVKKKKLGERHIDPINHVSPAHVNREKKKSNKAQRKFKTCVLNLLKGSRITQEGDGGEGTL